MAGPHLLHGILQVAPPGEAWHDFYLLAGTAAVTLVGLLFVSLSLHVEILFRPRHGDFREMAGRAPAAKPERTARRRSVRGLGAVRGVGAAPGLRRARCAD